jgi:hypothetical protein
VEEFSANSIRSPKAITHSCSAAPASSYNSTSTCETATPYMGYSGTANHQMLPSPKILLLQACYPDMMKLMVPNSARQIDVRGFSAGSFSGLAVHSVLSDFVFFP